MGPAAEGDTVRGVDPNRPAPTGQLRISDFSWAGSSGSELREA